MAVNLALFFAHQTAADYTRFANAVARGRPYRQALQSAADAASFAPGVELFFSNAGDVADIFAWLDGDLSWRPAGAARPANQLAIVTSATSLTGNSNLPGLRMVEAPPLTAIYDNVDPAAVRASLDGLLRQSYVNAAAAPTAPNTWHPSMRMQLVVGGSNLSLKAHLDANPPAPPGGPAPNPQTDIISQVVNALLGDASPIVVPSLRVRAGDKLGRAAAYLATDPLPENPGFPLGSATDAGRARRLTFQTVDRGEQPISPLHYHHIFLRRMFLPLNQQIVRTLTNVVDGANLRHPLATLYPALNAADPPAAREALAGLSALPLGTLADFHRYPPAAPASTYEWRYTDRNLFEARVQATGAAVNLPTIQAHRRRVANLWADHGQAIANIARAVQIPCEVIFGLIGAEAPADPNDADRFDARAVRLEPLKATHRAQITDEALELAYDHVVGVSGTATAVALQNNDRTLVTVQLNNARRWRDNFLSRSGFSLLVQDADRLTIRGNTGSTTQTTAYSITVSDRVFEGGAPQNGQQAAGTNLHYRVDRRDAGAANVDAVAYQLGRAGTIRSFRINATQNTVNGATTVTLLRNGQPALQVALAQGQTQAAAAVQVAVAAGDRLAWRVATGGAQGHLRNFTARFSHAPGVGGIHVLEGHSTRVPAGTWPGVAQVKQGSTLTWDQLVNVVDLTRGERISPGMIQTLISTARGALPFLDAIRPDVYAAVGVPRPPATAGGFLNDWLSHAVHSILVGAAYIRMGYNQHATRFDLPVVGGAYNAGTPQVDAASPWRVKYFSNYVEHAAPVANAAADFFNATPAPTPAPSVRFVL
jgi:hypothetical protein